MAMILLEMIPVGANGEKAAPLAAPTTTSVIRKADRPMRVASAIATGAISATEAILPGPIVVRNVVSKNRISGINRVLPPHSLTA